MPSYLRNCLGIYHNAQGFTIMPDLRYYRWHIYHEHSWLSFTGATKWSPTDFSSKKEAETTTIYGRDAVLPLRPVHKCYIYQEDSWLSFTGATIWSPMDFSSEKEAETTNIYGRHAVLPLRPVHKRYIYQEDSWLSFTRATIGVIVLAWNPWCELTARTSTCQLSALAARPEKSWKSGRSKGYPPYINSHILQLALMSINWDNYLLTAQRIETFIHYSL
jgi:hypothetical protein